MKPLGFLEGADDALCSIYMLNIILYLIQACQGDLAIGLYLWSRIVLPIVGGKQGSNPQTRDLVLQLVERYVYIVILLCSNASL